MLMASLSYFDAQLFNRLYVSVMILSLGTRRNRAIVPIVPDTIAVKIVYAVHLSNALKFRLLIIRHLILYAKKLHESSSIAINRNTINNIILILTVL